METLKIFLQSVLSEHQLIQGVLSNVKKGVQKTYEKMVVVPVVLKGQAMYHVAYHYQTKVMHENLSVEEMVDCFDRHLGAYFKQGVFYLKESDVQILFNKKGEWKKLTKAATKKQNTLDHNRKKQYLIPEGTPCDFMIRLGIMDDLGHVIPKKYDKCSRSKFLAKVLNIFGKNNLVFRTTSKYIK